MRAPPLGPEAFRRRVGLGGNRGHEGGSQKRKRPGTSSHAGSLYCSRESGMRRTPISPLRGQLRLERRVRHALLRGPQGEPDRDCDDANLQPGVPVGLRDHGHAGRGRRRRAAERGDELTGERLRRAGLSLRLHGRFELIDSAVCHQRQEEMAVPDDVRANVAPLFHDVIVQGAGRTRGACQRQRTELDL